MTTDAMKHPADRPGQARLPFAVMLMLAWRNLWRHRRRTVITLTSIAVGFGLAVVMIGLNDGGHNNMIRNAIKLGEGHLTVQPRGYLESPANHHYLADGKALAAKIAVAGSAGQRRAAHLAAGTGQHAGQFGRRRAGGPGECGGRTGEDARAASGRG